MIKTKKINTVAARVPTSDASNYYINVLTWHDKNHINGSKYHVFSPYYLKTDGHEIQHNPGGILFENLWQGSKLWPVYYDCEVWAHANLRGQSKHLWYAYSCDNNLGREHHLLNDVVQPEYYKWRETIFKCPKPIRYPNGYKRQSQVAFTLLIDKDGREERLDYIEARNRLYITEYCRLVRALPEFRELVEILKSGKTLIICEVDVPNGETMSIQKLETLAQDKNIKFGHGLCLAWELLKTLENKE